MINAFWGELEFTLQEGRPGEWLRVVDTSLPSPHDIADAGSEVPVEGLAYRVQPRSVVVLERMRR